MNFDFNYLARKIYQTIVPQKYGWFGNYSSWELAKKESSGYNANEILEKVKQSLLKVKNGEALYERDSVLFDKIEYSWPLLAGLMWIAAQNNGNLNVLDFGGSLGSTYFQNRKFLKTIKNVKWNIVEQELFVKCGKEFFEDGALKFYDNIENCFKNENPQVVIFSSVLQYIEKPYAFLQSVFEFSPQFIIVDIMPFIENGNDRITIQKVSPEIYDASYPCWFLNRKTFIDFLTPKYELITDFQSNLSILLDGRRIPYQGFIFKKL